MGTCLLDSYMNVRESAVDVLLRASFGYCDGRESRPFIESEL